MIKSFLDSVYAFRKRKDIDAFYDDWASTYDADVAENGYATPPRCAKALRQYTDDLSTAVLDVGCGTGLSGAALQAEGFVNLHGIDPAQEMISKAQAKNIYQTLTFFDEDEMPIAPESYDLVSCIGVIGVGAAPVTLLDQIMTILKPGGKFVLSLNDQAIQERVYEGRLNHYLDHSSARLLFREHGDHMPARNQKSFVYVVEKM